MTAVWREGSTNEQRYPSLSKTDQKFDDVVIGGGITGLATALKLLQAGRHVAVLEAAQVGWSSTGNSTGNLYSTVSSGLSSVAEKWNDDTIKRVVELRADAIQSIEKNINEFSIDCDFERVPLHFCVNDSDEKLNDFIKREYEMSTSAGLSAELLPETPELPFFIHRCLRIENQAQFNPFKYAQGLAKGVASAGGTIYENTQVTEIKPDQGIIVTDKGDVRADNIIQATHTPKGINMIQAEMITYREYAVAAPIAESAFPSGIYWMLSDTQSLRSYVSNGTRYVMAVGSKHNTGKGEKGEAYYGNVRQYLQSRFDVSDFTHRWSAQQYKAADLLPYIGRSGHDNVYIATGFAADGLVWGTLAGDMICQQITGEEHPATDLFNPRRFTPTKSVDNWVKENASVSKELLKTYLTPADRSEIDNLEPGQGKVMKVDGKKLAVCRSPQEKLYAVSPICPHMKCEVSWNAADISWDCPCHGSRFAPDGGVIEGPACEPLSVHLLENKP